jgi:dihydroxyacid dehydratase/phosphogluconate dehydratase
MPSAPTRARSSGALAGLAEGKIDCEQFMEIVTSSVPSVGRCNTITAKTRSMRFCGQRSLTLALKASAIDNL